MTQLVFDPHAFAWMVAGLVLGLVIGRIAWGGGGRRRRVVPVADAAALTAAAASARAEADARSREVATAQAALRPLSDEVDRLKRELARVRAVPAAAPVAAATTAAPVVVTPPPAAAAAPHVAPTGAVAGAGPVVVGDAATAAAPDIRQLKGVGDKFAAALSGLGLGTVDAIARLKPDEASAADTRLGTFNGRIARDRLVEQATLIDEGRLTEYETRFGKLGGPVLI